MEEEGHDDDDDANSVTSTSSKGRRPKAFVKKSNIDEQKLKDAISCVEGSTRKRARTFSVKDEWNDVAQIYFNKSRVRNNATKSLILYYNRHLAKKIENIQNRIPSVGIEQSSQSASLSSAPAAFTSKEKKWLSVASHLMQSATAGIFESAMRQASSHIFSSSTEQSIRSFVGDMDNISEMNSYCSNTQHDDNNDSIVGSMETANSTLGMINNSSTCDPIAIDNVQTDDDLSTHLPSATNDDRDTDVLLQSAAKHEAAPAGAAHEFKKPSTNDNKIDIDTSNAPGIFDSVGISHDTAETLAGCRLPKSKVIVKKLDGKMHSVKKPAEWNDLPILQKNGYRSYGGEYNELVLKIVRGYNPYCSFTMTSNFVKKDGSRKRHAAFHTGKGECQGSCPCKFKIILDPQSNPLLKLSFEGNVKHDITKPVARQIRGKQRELEKAKYVKNTKLNPTDEYRKKLHALAPASFAHGNRDGAGISKKTHQNIKAEAIHELNSFEVLHKELLKKQKTLIDIDQKKSMKECLSYRKIFGFLQTFSLTNDVLKAILFHEKTIRLFHDLCRKDIVYLDATGSVVQRISKLENIFLYSLAMRHPFGETYPLPTGMYITNSHNVESVRYFLMTLRESEKKLYGDKISQPRLIVSDNSNVLQNACLREFNGESRIDYYNRTYRIVSGSASPRDLQLTLLISCHNHIIGQVKRNLTKYDNSKRHFALRVIGRMINCVTLPELTKLVQNVRLVMTGKHVHTEVTRAVEVINEMVNDWCGDLNELIDSACPDATDEMDESNQDDDDDKHGDGKSLWQQYWSEALLSPDDEDRSRGVEDNDAVDETNEDNEQTTDNENDQCAGMGLKGEANESEEGRESGGNEVGDTEDKKTPNKYFMPKFFDYFKDQMLKDVAFWTKICFGDLSLHGERYADFLKEPNTCGRNFRIRNTSNACVENIFKYIKNDKSVIKAPLVQFIDVLNEKVNTLSKEFIDCILRNLEDAKDKDYNKRNINDLRKWQGHDGISDGSDDDEVPSPEKEIWSDRNRNTKKRKTDHSPYVDEPKKRITFNPVIQQSGKLTKKEETAGIKTFMKKNWSKEAEHHNNAKNVKQALQCKWNALSLSDKKDQLNPVGCCDDDDPLTPSFLCVRCEKKFHSQCTLYSEELAFLSDYVCQACVTANFQGMINCLHYSLRFNYSDKSIEAAVEQFSKMPLQRTEALSRYMFLPETFSFGEISVRSKVGIENNHNNCWLSSLVHCLFGTNIYDVLVSTVNDVTTARLFRAIHAMITSGSTDVFPTLEQLSASCNFTLSKCRCEDPCEAFEKFVDAISAEYLFVSNATTIGRCDECDGVSGGVKSIGVSIEINLPSYFDSSLPVENVLWYTFINRKVVKDDGYWCPRCRQILGATTYTFLTSCPVILPLKVNRTDHETRLINDGLISVRRVLSLQGLCPSYTDSEHCSYTLLASINNEGGESVKTNHFVSYLFDQKKNLVFRFDDDETISTEKIDTLLSSSDFQAKAYMLFYVRNDTLVASKDSSDITKRFDIPAGRRTKVDHQIFRERDDENFRIYFSILGNNKLTGDAVSAFIALQSSCSKLKVMVGTTNLLTSVKTGFLSKEYQSFLTINLNNYDMMVFPYHVKHNEDGHYSLLVVYPSKKAIFHLDSSGTSSLDPFFIILHLLRQHHKEREDTFLTDEWTCINPEVQRQTDVTSCGVWCCINAFKIMHEDDFACTHTDIPFVRYWIAEKVLGYKPKKLQKALQGKNDVSLPVKGPLKVCTSIPGKTDNGSVFLKIFNYRKASVADDVIPVRKAAQESRTKLTLLIETNQVEKADGVAKNKRKRMPRKHRKFALDDEVKMENAADDQERCALLSDEVKMEKAAVEQETSDPLRDEMKKENVADEQERGIPLNDEVKMEIEMRDEAKKENVADEQERGNPLNDEVKMDIEMRDEAKKENVADEQERSVPLSNEVKKENVADEQERCVPLSDEVKMENAADKQEGCADFGYEDDYTRRLDHVGKCKIKTSELLQYREFDRNVNTVRDDPAYLSKMVTYVREHHGFPNDDGSIKLAIDKDNGTAEVSDGNHRLTCAANFPNLTPEFVKVKFHFGHYVGKTKLPNIPSEWPSFLCGCDLGFTTNR